MLVSHSNGGCWVYSVRQGANMQNAVASSSQSPFIFHWSYYSKLVTVLCSYWCYLHCFVRPVSLYNSNVVQHHEICIDTIMYIRQGMPHVQRAGLCTQVSKPASHTEWHLVRSLICVWIALERLLTGGKQAMWHPLAACFNPVEENSMTWKKPSLPKKKSDTIGSAGETQQQIYIKI